MQLILREDVPNLGKKGDVVDVARGYARNFLLPRNLAMEKTENNLRRIEKERKLIQVRLATEKADAEALAARLSGLRLSFRRKVHEGNELYGSVSATDIAEELESKGYAVEKRRVQLDEPIKVLGEYSVSLRLHPDITVSIPLVVEKEEA
jgi:large subunit ribosomal protein L9